MRRHDDVLIAKLRWGIAVEQQWHCMVEAIGAFCLFFIAIPTHCVTAAQRRTNIRFHISMA